MSETVSALPGARFHGMVDLADAGPQGMIALRGDLALPELAAAVKKITGAALPTVREVSTGAKGAVAWMSPDELLLFVDDAGVGRAVSALESLTADAFVTVADVSDARALFTVKGVQARDVLAKACPVDLADFPVGTIRRTRAAQVAAAVWRQDDTTFAVICFRSVAGYMWNVLTTLSRPGGEVGYHR
ncbi:MAG: sarcosine oxidase subunit gamma [Pararhodobacter sp.]